MPQSSNYVWAGCIYIKIFLSTDCLGCCFHTSSRCNSFLYNAYIRIYGKDNNSQCICWHSEYKHCHEALHQCCHTQHLFVKLLVIMFSSWIVCLFLRDITVKEVFLKNEGVIDKFRVNLYDRKDFLGKMVFVAWCF